MATPIARLLISGVAFLMVNQIYENREQIKEQIKKLLKWVERKFSKNKVKAKNELNEESHDDIPEMDAIRCPISQEIMKNPVMTPYGHCFEKRKIEEYLENHSECPLTRRPLQRSDLKPCYSMKYAIEQYIKLQEELKKDN